MINIQLVENLQKYMFQNAIEMLLIFNGMKEEPSLIKPIIQSDLIDYSFCLIEQSGEPCLFLPGWFSDLAEKKYDMKVYPTDTKAHMIVDILPKITQDITLGLAGRISKHEYDLLESKVSHIVRLDVEIQKLNMKKSYKQVCALRGIRLLTENIMKSVQPAIGETEKSFEERIRTLVPAGYVVDFLSVAGYEAMKDATIGSAMDREIQAGDILCIDFGISNGVVHSDMTRCYQAGENGIYSDYLKIEEVIRNSLRFIKPGVSNKEYVHHLLSLSQQAGLQDCRFVDLGHGIGYDTHEYPDLYNDSFVFENGLCFTIEPEYKVGDRFIRFEDVYVLRDGECIPLSDFS